MTSSVTSTVALQSWGWRHHTRAQWSVDDVTFTASPGEVLLLAGASGAGKSTVLHAIAGLLDPDLGEQHGVMQVSGRVAYVQQDPYSQIVMARVGDDIAFGPENLALPVDEIHRRVVRAHQFVALDVPFERPTWQLSGGQAQRLAVAGAVAMDADVVLLDEPTSMLDTQGASIVRSLISSLRDAGKTVIVVEHRVEHIADVVDRTVVLGDPSGVWTADAYLDPVLEQDLVTALVGPNGCGKTTALLAMAQRPTWRSHDFVGRLGVAFQNPEHQFHFGSVREQLSQALITEFSLDSVADSNAFQLSGGEQRRLSVALALQGDPVELLLDEPSFGLDWRSWQQLVHSLAQRVRAGVKVTLATHDEKLIHALGARREQP